MHIVDSLRIARAKKTRIRGTYEIITNFTYLSSFVQFSAHLHHHFRELPISEIFLGLVFIPALNKGLTYLKIDSQKRAHQLSTILYNSIFSTTDAHIKRLEILFTADYR